jgi:hypothetical protein
VGVLLDLVVPEEVVSRFVPDPLSSLGVNTATVVAWHDLGHLPVDHLVLRSVTGSDFAFGAVGAFHTVSSPPR